MGGSELTMPVHAMVMMFRVPERFPQETITVGRGFSIVPGLNFFFIGVIFLL